MTRPRVFLSYANADRPFAASLAKDLDQAGVNAWLDSDVKPGDDWASVLRKELSESDLVIFVVPKDESPWALAEVGAARMLNKRILSVLPDRTRFANSSVARALSEWPIIDVAGLSQADLIETIISTVAVH